MEKVAPVTIAMSGVKEERHMIEYLPPNRAKPRGDVPAKAKKVKFAKKPEIKEVEKVQLPFHPRPRKNGAPPAPKRNKHKQTAEKHKIFLGHLEELGLLEDYRAAKNVDTDPDDVRNAKRKIRNQIAQIAQGSVHVPRSR